MISLPFLTGVTFVDLVADDLVADGLDADDLVADGLDADGFSINNGALCCPLSNVSEIIGISLIRAAHFNAVMGLGEIPSVAAANKSGFIFCAIMGGTAIFTQSPVGSL